MEGDVRRALVAQAASGDEVAFARIVDAYHGDLARVCFVVCHDPGLAQEAAQAAWAIAWRRLGSIRESERLRSWLLAIAVNEARQLVRRRGRRALREIAIDPHTERAVFAGSGDPADRAASIDLVNAITRLDVEDRTIVGLRYALGLSAAEIGQVIGMTDRGVRARLTRLLGRLREDLRDA